MIGTLAFEFPFRFPTLNRTAQVERSESCGRAEGLQATDMELRLELRMLRQKWYGDRSSLHNYTGKNECLVLKMKRICSLLGLQKIDSFPSGDGSKPAENINIYKTGMLVVFTRRLWVFIQNHFMEIQCQGYAANITGDTMIRYNMGW